MSIVSIGEIIQICLLGLPKSQHPPVPRIDFYPDLLVVIERLVAVMRWYVSTLYGSFIGRMRQSGGIERKPYNPVLGEQFICFWPSEEIGDTKLTSEQGIMGYISLILNNCFVHSFTSPTSFGCLFVKSKGWRLFKWSLRSKDPVHWNCNSS